MENEDLKGNSAESTKVAASEKPSVSSIDEVKTKVSDAVTDAGLINRPMTEGEKLKQRAEDFKKFSEVLVKYLPEEEIAKFLNPGPQLFCSKILFFRGFPHKMYELVKKLKQFPLKSGDMARNSVWLSDCPNTAFGYQDRGIIAVIPRSKIQMGLTNTWVSPGTPEYNKLFQESVAAGASVWDAEQDFDLRMGNYYATARPQPINVATVFLVWKDGKYVEEFPPSQE